MDLNKLIKIETIDFPTLSGDLKLTAYETNYPDQPNMGYALVITGKQISDNPMVRIHSECMLSEIFKSTHCDCREQLELGVHLIAENNGILFYLNQEGRGHGLMQKIKELKKQEEGMDTVEASKFFHLEIDSRKYDVVSDILKIMKIDSIQLITNNPNKIKGLEDKGIKITKRIPAEVKPNKHNQAYLTTKKDKLGHLLHQHI